MQELIDNIKANVGKYQAKPKGNRGYGELYEVTMVLVGHNGKSAMVLTGWLDDAKTGEIRLVTAHVDK